MNKKLLLFLTLFSVFSGQFVEAGKKNKKNKNKQSKTSTQQSSGGGGSSGPQPGSAAYAAAALLAGGGRASASSQVDLNNSKIDALIKAVKSGNVKAVKLLLRAGVNVNAESSQPGTALMIASQKGHVEVVKLLLEQQGINVDIQTSLGWTALMTASIKGQVAVVKLLLLQEGINVNAENSLGCTALMLAAPDGHVEVVRELLKVRQKGVQNIDVNAQNIEGATALMLAVRTGHVEIVKLLLQEGINVDIQTSQGCTAFMFAAQDGHVEVVKLLLEHDVDVELQTGPTALLAAGFNGHLEIVNLIQDKIESKSSSGGGGGAAEAGVASQSKKSGFHEIFNKNKKPVPAAKDQALTSRGSGGGGAESVRSISAAEAAAAIKTLQDNFRLAIRKNDHEKIKEICLALQQNGDDINTFVINPPLAATALLYAARKGKLKAVRYLLEECGANILQGDRIGRNILHYAAACGDDAVSIDSLILDILAHEYLNELNALINAQDHVGNTPLHFAKNTYNAIVLTDAGARTDVTNKQGRLPKFVKKATTGGSGGGGDATSESKQ